MEKKQNNSDFLAKCSVCGSDFSNSDQITLEEKQGRLVFHATCRKCKSASIIFSSNNPAGIVSLGMATDLDQDEARRMFGADAVSADEVIDMHQFISRQEGKIESFIM